MAALGGNVSIGTTATLIFEVVDGTTYAEQAYTRTSNPQIFKSGFPVPFLLVFPSSGTIYLGGSGVTSSSTGIGCAIVCASQIIPYNCPSGDSLYGIVASSTATLNFLVMGQ